MERSELDHIVIAAASLEAGVAWVEQRLGVKPVPGGRHVAMGTDNALLRRGARCYLEVIAIDPDGETPARPRWFSLDEPEMQARLAAAPALITWCSTPRTDPFGAETKSCGSRARRRTC